MMPSILWCVSCPFPLIEVPYKAEEESLPLITLTALRVAHILPSFISAAAVVTYRSNPSAERHRQR